MQIEHGFIPGEPGMEEAYTIIGETMRMNPDCPCPTRACPNHGFCKYCVIHHKQLDQRLIENGREPHGVVCKRRKELGGVL